MKAKEYDSPTLLNKMKKKLQNKWIRIVTEWSGITIMAFISFIPRTVQVGTSSSIQATTGLSLFILFTYQWQSYYLCLG